MEPQDIILQALEHLVDNADYHHVDAYLQGTNINTITIGIAEQLDKMGYAITKK